MATLSAEIQHACNRSSALTIGSTPVRMGSTHGNFKSAEVRFKMSFASSSGNADVLSATPTKRTFGLVRRAAAKYEGIASSSEGTGKLGNEAIALRARS